MRWLIDIDDVLAELAEYWISLYNKDYGENLKKSDIHDWNIGGYTKIGSKMYDYLDDPHLYENIQTVPYALNGINAIRNNDPEYEMIYVTHSTRGHVGQKYDWLIKHGFLQEHDQYFEGLSKHSISKFLFKADVMIDDNPRHIQEFEGELAVLFNQPWNIELQKTHSPTLKNWKVLIDRMEALRQ